MPDLPMLGGASGFVATGTPTTTSVQCTVDTSDATADAYAPGSADRLAGMFIVIASGFQKAVMRKIASSAVNGTTLTITFAAMPEAMEAGDAFYIGGLA